MELSGVQYQFCPVVGNDKLSAQSVGLLFKGRPREVRHTTLRSPTLESLVGAWSVSGTDLYFVNQAPLSDFCHLDQGGLWRFSAADAGDYELRIKHGNIIVPRPTLLRKSF